MEYPQHLRNAYVDAYADKCSALWRLVDAKERVALLGLRTTRGNLAPRVTEQDVTEARAKVARLSAEKDEAVSRSLAALRALAAAENTYYSQEGANP